MKNRGHPENPKSLRLSLQKVPAQVPSLCTAMLLHVTSEAQAVPLPVPVPVASVAMGPAVASGRLRHPRMWRAASRPSGVATPSKVWFCALPSCPPLQKK